MLGLKKSVLMRNLFITIAAFVFLGLMVSSQAMALTTVEETTIPGGNWLGTWTPFSHANASGGSLNYSNDVAYASCSFSFSGSYIAWIGLKQNNMGKSEVWIDGFKMATVDLYSSSTQWKQVLYRNNSLPPGEHTIVIRPTNKKNSSSSGLYTSVDAFEVCSSNICFISPKAGDIWQSGVGQGVELALNKAALQYRLYVKCASQPWNINNPLTIQSCDYYGKCPNNFQWLVPPVSTGVSCMMGAILVDEDFNPTSLSTALETAVAAKASDPFLINPAVPIAGFTINPLTQNVAAGDAATYEVTGGTPPYKVATLRVVPPEAQLQRNYDYTTIDTIVPPLGYKTYTNATSSFTIENTWTCPEDEELVIVIGAQDSAGVKTYGTYYIKCSP